MYETYHLREGSVQSTAGPEKRRVIYNTKSLMGRGQSFGHYVGLIWAQPRVSRAFTRWVSCTISCSWTSGAMPRVSSGRVNGPSHLAKPHCPDGIELAYQDV